MEENIQNSWSKEFLFPPTAPKKKHKRTLKEIFIYSPYMRISYIIILCLTLGFIAPYVINTQMSFSPKDQRVAGTCHVQVGMRINCFPDRLDPDKVNETECEERGCCYQNLNLFNGAPVCHRKIPSVHTLNVTGAYNQTDGSLEPAYPEISKAWPNTEQTMSNLRYQIRQTASGHVTVLLYDVNNQPPIDLGSNNEIEDVDISLSLQNDERLALRLNRKRNSQPLIDAAYGSVYVTKQFSELNILLPTGVVYGLGGHPISFNQSGSYLETNFTKHLFYNFESDLLPGYQHSHQIFMMTDNHQEFAGVYLETNGAPAEAEIMPGLLKTGLEEFAENQTLVGQRPLLGFRSMSNFILLHLFVGPTPKDVIQQLTTYLGRPRLPEVWSLGLHICRKTEDDSADLRMNLEKMKEFNLTFDSDCLSENLMATAFTTNSKFDAGSLFSEAINAGKKIFLSLPPHVAYSEDLTNKNNFFIKNSFANESLLVEFGNGIKALLPDFTNTSIFPWFQENLGVLFNQLPDAPDGLRLIKGSPQVRLISPCEEQEFTFVPGIPTIPGFNLTIFDFETLCPDSKHTSGDHIYIHNRYPLDHTEVMIQSLDAINLQKVTVLSKYSSPGKNQLLFGSDRLPTWENLGKSLIEVLELGISGSGLVSMQACGMEFDSNANQTETLDELCLRWYQLSSFMPALNSIHGDEKNPRMPYSFSKTTYTNWIRRALFRRVRLAPYMYTQMFQSSNQTGLPLVRPLFMEFYDDPNLNYNNIIWKQFMFGDSIMVTPVLEQGIKILEYYLPRGVWYELWSGLQIEGYSKLTTAEVIEAQISAYIRSDSIIPLLSLHESDTPGTTLEAFSKYNYTLIVALACDGSSPRSIGDDCQASGSLLAHFSSEQDLTMDDYVIINIDAKQNSTFAKLELSSNGVDWIGCSDQSPQTTIDSILVYGTKQPSLVQQGDSDVRDFTFDPDLNRLHIESLSLNWCDLGALEITWTLQ